MSNERERVLARALKAALKWPYDPEMIAHIKGKPIDRTFDPTYVADIKDIAAGVKAAREIGEST